MKDVIKKIHSVQLLFLIMLLCLSTGIVSGAYAQTQGVQDDNPRGFIGKNDLAGNGAYTDEAVADKNGMSGGKIISDQEESTRPGYELELPDTYDPGQSGNREQEAFDEHSLNAEQSTDNGKTSNDMNGKKGSGPAKAASGNLPSEIPGWDKSGESGVSGDWAWVYFGEYNDAGQKVNRFYISGYRGSATSITVPDVLNGREVYGVYGYYDDDIGFSTVKNITFSKGLKKIGARTFEYNESIETIAFENGSNMKEIGEAAFYCCENLTSAVFPDSLEELNAETFNGCYNLTKVTLPPNLKPFYGRIGLFNVIQDALLGDETYYTVDGYYNPFCRSRNIDFTLSGQSKNFKLVNGTLYSKDGTVLYYRKNGTAGSTFNVPSTVKYIASYAFVFDGGLAGITLPNGLQTIGESAFNSTGITSVVIPDTVSFIDSDAFCYCKSLTRVSIGAGIKDLQQRGATTQFYGCSSLTEVSFSNGLERISWNCFADCSSLQTVTLPNSLKTIGRGAFGRCTSLQTVTGAPDLTTIGGLAFYRTKIRSFPYGDKLQLIAGTAFQEDSDYDNKYPAYLKAGDLDGDGVDDYYLGTDRDLVVKGADCYDLAYQVLSLVNKERNAQGLSSLTMDRELLEAAMQRAAELTARFNHTRPNGSPAYSISKKMMAENIAVGQSTAAGVMDSWMNSAGHRSNILGSTRKSIGVGCYKSNGVYYWVQIFGDEEAESISKGGTVSNNRKIDLIPNRYLPTLILSAKKTTMGVGKTLSIRALIEDSEDSIGYGQAHPGSFTWTSSNTNAATVNGNGIVKGKGVGNTTITAVFPNTGMTAKIRITVKRDISDATVSGVSDKHYTGKAIKQSPVVKIGNSTLKKGTDYTLSYKNNVKVGTAKITIKGKGNYTGTKTVTFKITYAPGGDPNQKGRDGTAVGRGASAASADKAITSMKSDTDPKGSVFGKLRVKSPKQTKSSITIKWTKNSKATRYVIYGNKCGKTTKPRKLLTVKSGNSRTIKKIAGKKLKKGTYYKFIIVALDKKKNVVSTSKLIHVATKGGKVGNYKRVTVRKSVIKKAKKLKKGRTLTLKARAVPQSKKLKVRQHVGIRYESSNKKIATVSKQGKIKARKKGACYVYAYAQNGVFKKIKVVVK